MTTSTAGRGKDAVKADNGTDAVAADVSNRKEVKDRRGQHHEYQTADFADLRSDIKTLHEQVVPGSHVGRVEVENGIYTMYYTFDDDPKLYKTVVDGSGTEIQLVTREISPNELRNPALEEFKRRNPGAQISNVLQHSHGTFDIRYRDADGTVHEGQTTDLIWTLDDAEEDSDNDGIGDHHGDGGNGQNGDGQGGDGQGGNGQQGGDGQHNGGGQQGSGDGQNGNSQLPINPVDPNLNHDGSGLDDTSGHHGGDAQH